MRLIAHRVFRDGEKLERFDARRFTGFDGVEMDLRVDPCGSLVVRHAPVFAVGHRLRRLRGARLDDALALIGREPQAPRLLLLDVKCVTAARAAADLLAQQPTDREVVFACWHAEEAAEIRARLPHARILFCAAPIVARRAPAGALEDLYLANSFPFLWPSDRFSPRLGKANRHNINVRLISRRRGGRIAPEGVDGLCVHRLFWGPRLADLAREQGVEIAVYGLNSRAQAQAAAAYGPLAYAIIGEGRRAGRRAERSQSLHAAA
jgi:glycerophosphoryl diester phosphodiesterase